ncbi:MAG: response regulator [Deltaproteobacteria bacterium]|nr:response regulator [Deltaproteobacteria bacterium]
MGIKKKKILVVDNDKVILKLMTDFLAKDGFHVLTAENGLSALEVLKTYIPDVMFVDLIMPNIDGKKLCRIIRDMPMLSNVYIIILSAVAAEEEINHTEFGANACIAKGPFNSMSHHILTALNELERKHSKALSEEVMGLKNIHFRTITKELLSSQKHFETILEGMSEGILELTPEARIVYCNPVAVSLLDMPEDKLLASDFTELFQENDSQRIKKLLNTTDHTSRTISEDSPVALNGSQLTMKILPVRDEGNETIVVILNDISLRKKMQAQLVQAQKMEAIGTLAGGTAHDFNNLLMGMQGYVSLMLMDIEPTHPHYQRLKAIETQVESGAELTRQLLGFARGGKYEVKSVNINELITKTSNMFGRTKKEIKIHRKYQKGIWTIEVDPVQIEQVLLNFYVNAWQAMSKGGDLDLQTENITLDENYVKHFKIEPGNYVKVSISDTGLGMDKKTKERIFEPFFTTKEMGRGTGLGLASVYGIIKNHGGFINVYSEEGKGTTFTFYLPASGSEVSGQKSEIREVVRHGNETVLLIDDEDMIIDVAKQLLEKMGYTVLIARSGKEAVETYEKNKDEIDIVILDMIMPEISGGETFDRLKSINPRIKVLLSSGYSIDGQAAEILKRGCDGFIQKPFKISELSESIRLVLN